ncbi:hypothetical protein [Streptomyces sp. NPDC046909]|uniref:hypothetical protein n=1 Tax=Streptomyces sp. NPDC046909 TaxID=3155617 RepID=UPI0033F488B1
MKKTTAVPGMAISDTGSTSLCGADKRSKADGWTSKNTWIAEPVSRFASACAND